MTLADAATAHEILERSFSMIVAEGAEEREDSLSATLDALRDLPVRFMRVASPRGKLSLKRMLAPAGDADADGEALTLQALSARHADEEHVLLVIEQAETLEAEALPTLRALIDAQSRRVPTLHVLFVGAPALLDLGLGAAAPPARGPAEPPRMAGSRATQGTPQGAPQGTSQWEPQGMPQWAPQPVAAFAEREPLGRTRTRAVVLAMVAAGLLGLLVAGAYALLSPRVTPGQAQAVSGSTTAPRAPPPPATPSASTPVPAPVAPTPVAPTPATLAPPEPPSPPSSVEQALERARLRADFEQFLASSDKATAKLSARRRNRLFQEYLAWRKRHAEDPPR